jgi:four helix bundle protein
VYAAFNNVMDFRFRNQVCSAVVSISNNIAEGFDRGSDKDFCRFLYIAAGSASGTRSMIYLAARLKYIDDTKKITLLERTDEVLKVIRGFIKVLSKSFN